MKLSVKSDYATRAVLGLARHYPTGAAMRADDLAEAHAVPSNYLMQILLDLKAKNIVRSVRGKQGGFLLARSPADISLGDVLRAVHGTIYDAPALADPDCPSELRHAWERLQHAIERAADEITFQQLLEESNAKEKMYYI